MSFFSLLKAYSLRIFIFLSMLFFYGDIKAQAWTVYDVFNSSLPENSVRCLAQEKNSGKLWIGTDFGLASLHNGIWSNFNSLNSGLPDNRIRALCVDHSGIKWIGTFDGGLASYNDTSWTIYNTFNSPIPDNYVKSLAMDSTQNLWIGTIGGLGRFDGVNWNVYQMFSDPIQSNNIASIRIAPDNTRWFGTINGGLARLVDTTWTIFSIHTSGIPDNSIIDIRTDNQNKPWLATPAAGLVSYLGATSWLVYNNSTNSNIPFISTYSVGILPNQTKFVGTQAHGLARLKNGTWDFYSTSNSPIPDNGVLCLLEESQQTLWLGTWQGLVKLDLSVLNSSPEIITVYNFSVGPNPASEILNVFNPENKELSYNIIDVSGRILQEGKLNTSWNTLSIVGLAKGIFIIQIKAEFGIISKKIICN